MEKHGTWSSSKAIDLLPSVTKIQSATSVVVTADTTANLTPRPHSCCEVGRSHVPFIMKSSVVFGNSMWRQVEGACRGMAMLRDPKDESKCK